MSYGKCYLSFNLNNERRDHWRKTDRNIGQVTNVSEDPACRNIIWNKLWRRVAGKIETYRHGM